MNQAAAAKPPPTWAVLVAFGIIYTAWGTTYYPIKVGVAEEHLPPLIFNGTRIIIAGALLVGYQWLRGMPLRLSGRDAVRMIGISWLLFVAGNGLVTYSQRTLDSSVAAVLIATTPLWIGLFVTLWPQHGERLTPRGWAGLVAGLVGVVFLIAPKLADVEKPFDTAGFAFVLGSAAAWAAASVLMRHVRFALPHLTAAGYEMLIGGVSMLALAGCVGEVQQFPDHLSSRAIQVFLYLLTVGSLAGFVAFNWLLGHVSAAKVGTYAYVNPLVAVLIGWAMGEVVSWQLFAGMGVILFGVFLVRGGGG